MKKIFSIVVLLLAFLITETLLSFVIGFLYTIADDSGFNQRKVIMMFSDYAFLGIMRLMFYFVFSIGIFSVLGRELNLKNRVMQLMIINCSMYVFISLLYGFIFMPDTKDYLARSFFYIIILSTLLSPVIIYKIPFFRKLADSGVAGTAVKFN
ncbi:hypothetical protein ACX0HA_01770 [Flavobacterium hauense]